MTLQIGANFLKFNGKIYPGPDFDPFKLTHALEACMKFNGSQLGNTERIFN